MAVEMIFTKFVFVHFLCVIFDSSHFYFVLCLGFPPVSAADFYDFALHIGNFFPICPHSRKRRGIAILPKIP